MVLYIVSSVNSFCLEKNSVSSKNLFFLSISAFPAEKRAKGSQSPPRMIPLRIPYGLQCGNRDCTVHLCLLTNKGVSEQANVDDKIGKISKIRKNT